MTDRNHPGGEARRVRRSLAERRTEILRAATTLVADHGYRGLTIEQVATACSMSKAGLLHHFPSKQALLVELLSERDRLDGDRLRSMFSATPGAETLRAALAELVRQNQARPELIRLYTVLAVEALEPGHPAHDYFRRRRVRAREQLEALAVGWHPDPARLAVRILSFLDGLQLNWLADATIDLVAEWDSFATSCWGEYVCGGRADDRGDQLSGR